MDSGGPDGRTVVLPVLETLAKVGAKLHRARHWLWVIVVLAVLAFFAMIFFGTTADDEALLLASVTVALWAFAFLGWAHAFVVPVTPLDKNAPLLRRWWQALRRGARWLGAMVVLALFLVALWLTLRLIGML
ncbi:MAG: hypothetical protein ACI8PT_000891 [Gammaproteobacteria bacterium]